MSQIVHRLKKSDEVYHDLFIDHYDMRCIEDQPRKVVVHVHQNAGGTTSSNDIPGGTLEVETEQGDPWSLEVQIFPRQHEHARLLSGGEKQWVRKVVKEILDERAKFRREKAPTISYYDSTSTEDGEESLVTEDYSVDQTASSADA